jgi:hypothetical protein
MLQRRGIKMHIFIRNIRFVRNTLYRKFKTNIPRNETSRLHIQECENWERGLQFYFREYKNRILFTVFILPKIYNFCYLYTMCPYSVIPYVYIYSCKNDVNKHNYLENKLSADPGRAEGEDLDIMKHLSIKNVTLPQRIYRIEHWRVPFSKTKPTLSRGFISWIHVTCPG